MKFLKYLMIASVAAGAVSLFSCGRAQTGDYHKGAAYVACYDSFRNVMEQEVQVFEHNYPGSNVMDIYVDEDAAIDSLLDMDNHIRLAVTSRPLDKKEISYLNSNNRSVHQQAIAVDAVALIVNPENPIEYIDNNDLVDILTGKFTTWDSIVPGGKTLGKILVAFDHQGSSTARYMRDSLMNGAPFGPNVYAQKTPREVFDIVAKTKNAIGIIGASWLTDDMSGGELSAEEIARLSDVDATAEMTSFVTDVKVLPVQGIDELQTYLPTQYKIFTGKYPYYRQIYLISTSIPSSVGLSFFTFVTSAVGQKVILSTGVCPKVITPQFVEL